MSTAVRRLPLWLARPRRILLAVIGLSVIAGGLQIGLPAYRQRLAIRAVERLGGTVISEPVPPAWLPRWCRDRLARSLVSVWSIDLADSSTTDADLACVAPLSGLHILNLDGTPTTDAGIARLEACRELQHLNLSRTRITDAGLDSISGMTNLQRLYLCETSIGDAGLYRIRRLREIAVLDLMNTDVSDAGLQHLRRMTRLRRLDVYGTHVTSGGIAELRKVLPNMGVNFRRPPQSQ
jgi:hypothetical protein